MEKKKALMLGRAIFLSFSLLILLLFSLSFASAICNPANTPLLKPADYFEIGEGNLFTYEFNITNMPKDNIAFTYALFDKQLHGLSISNKGVLSFTPGSDAVGVSRIAIIAAKEDCADTIIMTIKVFARPDIVYFTPSNATLQINQTGSVIFRVRAQDTDANDSLTYNWLLDSQLINESYNKTSLVFAPGYALSGVHEISAVINDTHNLSAEMDWELQIASINRPPVLLFNVSNMIIFWNTATGAYDLNDYFIDPDGGKLRFEYEQVFPAYEKTGVSYANVSVNIGTTGFVSYDPATNTTGYAYFRFKAYDVLNASAESNVVKVDVLGSGKLRSLNDMSTKQFCGDSVCNGREDCKTCPYDCGSCPNETQPGCRPIWNCTGWSPCQFTSFQARKCIDLTNCGDNRTKPDEFKMCSYNATCNDSIRNGLEEGVDCGGPCSPCPNCFDGIQNQGEEGVDCGGPCNNPCPSCSDNIKNQNETDIDCGGPCQRCAGGQNCLKNLDCNSLRCDHLICTFANCSDQIKNQGEGGVDCGGPCANPCGNCSDGMQNQGEEGVDCGGKCKPCATCSDKIKNQNEILTDCGGSCKACNLKDYIAAYTAIFIIIIIVLCFIPLGFASYIFFLFANPDRARGLYENNASFTFIVFMNRLFIKLRVRMNKKPAMSEEAAKSFIGELGEIEKKADNNKVLHDEVVKIFTALLGLPEDFDNNIFNMKLRSSNVPLFLKILFAGYHKRSEILVISSFVSAEEKADLIVEMKFLLTEVSRG